jgi:imidazolonepropionase-like amidohydrolase
VDVVDVEAGSILPDRTVLVAQDRIVGVLDGPTPDLPPGAQVIDGEGLYAIPGLWDMHVHMVNDVNTLVPWDVHVPEPGDADSREIYMPVYLAFGVTGTREMSGGLASLELRRRIEEGEILGPHMVVGSPLLDGGVPTFPEGAHILIDGPEEARAVVDSLHAAGFDFLKPYSLLLPETYRALVERARELGMPVSGELPVTVSAWEAAERGQRTVEHLTGLEFAASTREEELRAEYLARLRALNADPTPSADEAFDIWHRSEWEPFESLDPRKEVRLFRHLADHDTWVVPTLVVQRMISHADDPAVADDPDFRYIDPWSRDLEALRDDFDPQRRLRAVHDHRLRIIDDLHDAGVGIMAGSDTPGGFTLLEELELFVASGLTPLEALRTATLNPARYLGREDELGTIAPGRIADVVLLRGDPLRDIGNVRAIETVIFQGHVLDRAELDRMLAQLEVDAANWPE